MSHFDDSIRILALDVIISSHSSREDFSLQDLDLVKNSIYLNMVLQNSADRQQMITIMKKLILRLKAAMTTSTRSKQNEEIELKYSKFVQNLFEYFFESIFENASFSRRSLALECIHDFCAHLNPVIKNLKNMEKAEKLLNVFHDSFEHNKKLALEIIKTFIQDDVLMLKNEEFIKEFLENTLELTRSYKPPDSISAGYHIKSYQSAVSSNAGKVLCEVKVGLLEQTNR